MADTELADGSSANLSGGPVTAMQVRADGGVDGRRVSVIRIPVPAGVSAAIDEVLLELDGATISGNASVSAHVYGLTDHSRNEGSATWANTS